MSQILVSKNWFTYLEHATTEKDHRGKADNVLNIYSTNRHLIQLVQYQVAQLVQYQVVQLVQGYFFLSIGHVQRKEGHL